MTRATRRLVLATIAAVVVILIGGVLGRVLLRYSPDMRWVGQTLVIVTPLAGLAIVVVFLWRLPLSNRERPPVCEKCGYDLTGNTSGVCPECGTKVVSP